MTRPLIIFTDRTDLDQEPARRILEDAGFATLSIDLPGSGLPEAAREAVGLIVGYARVDAAVLDRLPNLRIVTTTSAGFDMVDSAELTRRGIWLSPLPDAATEEVAAHALTLLLAAERHLPAALATTAAGGWTAQLPGPLPRRLSTLTLGLYGCGRIARRLARIAGPLLGRVIAHDPYLESYPAGVDGVEPSRLLAESDILSLHLPLTEQTRGLLGARELAALRPGALLINVSRGELVEESALLAALDSGGLRAALDVTAQEPPAATHPLRSHPRALLTPHTAFASEGSLEHYLCEPARTLVTWSREGAPPYSVTPGPGGARN